PEELDALLLSGTGTAPAALAGGLALTSLLAKTKGPTARPGLVQKMAFGAYLDKIDDPATPYDWISRDSEMVAKYSADPKCTFVFTVSAFHEMFWVLRQVNRRDWYHKVPQELPILLLSGDMDPVGEYGKGIQKIHEELEKTGHQRLEMMLYPGGRHEMLNETNRAQVYEDILAWCGRALGQEA
ncbi:MAG: alpha/beta hydrolase, partial [Oscillospiraceae bacterium]|nr:alpha/beta hydrolase [Oscillospiraceae bacterium]